MEIQINLNKSSDWDIKLILDDVGIMIKDKEEWVEMIPKNQQNAVDLSTALMAAAFHLLKMGCRLPEK
jgi:hypothetical protein